MLPASDTVGKQDRLSLTCYTSAPCDRSPFSISTSSPALPALAWRPIGRPLPKKSDDSIESGSTGDDRFRDSAIRRRACMCWGWRRQPMAAIERAESLPVIEAETGFTRRSITSDLRTRRPRRTETTALHCRIVTSGQPFAAPHRTISLCRKSSNGAVRLSGRSYDCCKKCGWSWSSEKSPLITI